MALGDILKKIEGDADKDAHAVLEQARLKEKELLAAAQKEAGALTRSILEGANIQSQKERMRALSEASMKSRLLVLEEKHLLIEEAFAKAVEAMSKVDKKEYDVIRKKMLAMASETGEEKIEEYPGGGFILRGEESSVDMTFPRIVEELKPRLISEVAKILFK